MAQDEKKSEEWKNDEFVVCLSGLSFMTDELLKHFYENKDGFIGYAENGRAVDFDKIVGFCKSDPFNFENELNCGAVARKLRAKYSKSGM